VKEENKKKRMVRRERERYLEGNVIAVLTLIHQPLELEVPHRSISLL